LVFAYAYYSKRSAAQAEDAWSRYFAALTESSGSQETQPLRQVAQEYPGSQAGMWARLSLADLQLKQAIEALFNDRAAAKELLDEAARNYAQVRDSAKATPLLAQRATLGLAQAYESHNELDEAREAYAELKSKWPDSPFAEAAERRLADLDQRTTKDFYDWFAKQRPKPSAPQGPGIPGQRPSFDASSLDDGSFFGDLGLTGRPGSAASGEAASGEAASGEADDDNPLRIPAPDGSDETATSDEPDTAADPGEADEAAESAEPTDPGARTPSGDSGGSDETQRPDETQGPDETGEPAGTTTPAPE
jgi:hypothetical protein